VFAGLLDYAALGGLFVLYYSFSASPTKLADVLLVTWLCVPVPVLSVLPAFFLVVLGSLILSRSESHHEARQATTLRELLLLLGAMRMADSPWRLSTARRRGIMNRIARVARRIRLHYSFGPGCDSAESWAADRMNRIADGFLGMSGWIALPMKDTIDQVKSRIVQFTNAFAAGEYASLATTAQEGLEALKAKRQGARPIWRTTAAIGGMFGLMALPGVTFAFAVLRLGVAIPDVLTPVGAILYSGWIGLCILAYIDHMEPEAKSMVVEVFGMILRR
jgi:hypothetical protein